MPQKLSILIPAFNEERTMHQILGKIIQVDLPQGMVKEIIVIDDCSTDTTFEIADQFKKDNPLENIFTFRHSSNKGKGAAIHTGIQNATGDFTVVQDADLEYDPREYAILLGPVLEGVADVVYGSRFVSGKPHRILFFWHSIGNKFLTFLSNMCTDLNLTDMETCYKMFRSDILKQLRLKEKRFGFEPEVTAKIAKVKGIRIYEVGISYYGRTFEDGKKIKWQDGFRAIYCILKYKILQ